MLTYNSQLPDLTLPEYGRNIQQMVDHCVAIEDRDERTAAACAIVKAMEKLFPKLREQEDFRRKLWDHLALMSDYKLDIDWPCEITPAEERASRPERVPYPEESKHHRHYGKMVERMLGYAVEMEGGPEKDALIILLANQMKKAMTALNGTVEDERIFADIAFMTDGAITIAPDSVRLCDYNFLPAPSRKKKKKK